jgi:hypothetical protein
MAQPDNSPVIDVGGATPLPQSPDPLINAPQAASGQGPVPTGAPLKPGDIIDMTDTAPPPAPAVGLVPGAIVDEKDVAPPDWKAHFQPLVDAAADKYGVPRGIAEGLVHVESGWNPDAIGPAVKNPDGTTRSAHGLTQLMPDTAKGLGVDPKDPVQNIDGGMKYLGQLIKQFDGNVPMALQAYNAGPNAPSRWKPIYAAKVYAAGGVTPPETFPALTQSLTDLKSGDRGGWNAATELAQGATSGLERPILAAVGSAITPGDTFQQEMDLLKAQQTEYGSKNPIMKLGADVAGTMIPGVGAAKLASAGGRALAQAAPILEGPISTALGTSSQYAPGSISSGVGKFTRAVTAGGLSGVLNSQVTPDASVGDQAEWGAIGGGLGNVGAKVLGAVGTGAKQLYQRFFQGEGGMLTQAQQELGKLVGPDAPPLEASSIPGVQRTLPELLGGENADVSAKLNSLSKGSPEYWKRVEQNNAARVEAYHKLTGSPADVEALQAKKDELNTLLSPILKNPKAKDIDLSSTKNLIDQALDSPNTKMESYESTLRKVRDSLFKKNRPGPEAGDTMTLDKLAHHLEGEAPPTHANISDQIEENMKHAMDTKPKVLENRPDWIFGIRKSIQELLDQNDKGQTHLDSTLKTALTAIKNDLTDKLKSTPGFAEYRKGYAQLSERQKELEYLQSKKAVNAADILSPAVLKNTITEIKQSGFYRGVLGQKAKAKSVTHSTVEGLEALLDDIQVANKANVPTSRLPAVEPMEGPHGKSLFHYTSGTVGTLVAHAFGVPAGAGWVAGTVGQKKLEGIGQAVRSARDRQTLKALLDPIKHPPIPPKAPNVPPGTYSGLIGGSAVNSVLGRPDDRKGK